jgi:hypothetical protein
MDYVAPKFQGSAFNCPVCNVYAHQSWANLYQEGSGTRVPFLAANCAHCGGVHLWKGTSSQTTAFGTNYTKGMLVEPEEHGFEPADKDMPPDVRQDYDEAAGIFSKSPRGAAALLRLGLQKLCRHLGQAGNNINEDVRALAAANVLPPLVIKVADTVRIVGNNAVHPGEMSDDDFDMVAQKMFNLLNFIVRKGISEPKELEALYQSTPEQPRKAAEARDQKFKQQVSG